MNIREIRQILSENSNIDRDGSYLQSSNYKFSNLVELRKSLDNLYKLPFLRGEIDKIMETSIYKDPRDEIVVDQKEKNIVDNTTLKIEHQIEGIIKFINNLSKDESAELLFVKLPIINSIDDFIGVLSELKKAVELPILELGDNIKIINCEPGSIWITILIGSSVGLRLIGRLVKIATDANLEIQKGKIFSNYADNLKLQNQVLEQFKEAQSEILKGIIQTGAIQVNQEEFEGQDNERIGRLKLAIKSISGLLSKGAQFLPSFKSADEIKELYPAIEDEIKQIEGGVKSLIEGTPDDNTM